LSAAYRAHEKKSLLASETLYGAEAYDAIVIAALAAIEAKSTKTEDIKAHMVSVTKGGTKVKTFKAAVAAIKAGKDIDYEGQSGPVDFDSNGNPSKAYMNIFKYNAKGTAALSKSYLTAVPTK
jgi:branched-chain amino acid transport system substrate-binding protein